MHKNYLSILSSDTNANNMDSDYKISMSNGQTTPKTFNWKQYIKPLVI